MAASVTATVNSNNPVVATGVTLIGLSSNTYNAIGPIVAGTTVCPVGVAPSTWAGTPALSGAGASFFVMAGSTGNWSLKVAVDIPAGTSESVTVTANP